NVFCAPLRIGLRVILAGVAAAALGTHERAPSDRFAYSDEVLEVEREVPTGVVDAGPGDPYARGPRAQSLDAHERFLELALRADDPDELLHRVLKIGLDLVRVFVSRALERRGDPVGICPQLGLVDARGRAALGVVGGRESGAPAEHEEIRKRVAAEA